MRDGGDLTTGTGSGAAVDWETEAAEFLEETYKAHGLQGTVEEPDWPRLTLAEVDRVLQRFPQTGGATRILSYSPRPFSAASVVATPLGRAFVKRHHGRVRDREGLLEEHRFLAHLAAAVGDAESDAGLVRAAWVDSDGRSVVEDEEWVYEVHPLARGLDVYEEALSWTPFLQVGHARAAGRALARLHQAAEGYDAPARAARQLVTSFTIFGQSETAAGPVERMQAYLESRPLLKEYAERRDWRRSLDELPMPFYRRLEPWLGGLTPLWTHNDFHASNLTWSGAGAEAEVLGIVDFGLSDRTTAVHDLATAIERNCVEWLRMDEPGANLVRVDQVDALLAGYEELRPLSYEDAKALAALLPLVHCEFALSETDYFLSILGSPEKAYLAYEGYFVGHVEWFLGAEGRRLTEHLERWADARGRR